MSEKRTKAKKPKGWWFLMDNSGRPAWLHGQEFRLDRRDLKRERYVHLVPEPDPVLVRKQRAVLKAAQLWAADKNPCGRKNCKRPNCQLVIAARKLMPKGSY